MAVGTGAAILGSAAIGVGGSILAGKEQAKGAEAAGATEMAMYNQTREDLAPYRDIGYQALNVLGPMFIPNFTPYEAPEATNSASPAPSRPGVFTPGGFFGDRDRSRSSALFPGGSRDWKNVRNEPTPEPTPEPALNPVTGGDTPDYSAFYQSPGYQFRMDEGVRARDRSASSRGMLRSGALQRELTRYGQGVASEEFNNYANRLASLAGLGQTSTAQTGQFGAGAAAGLAQSQQNAATARASGYAGVANAAQQGIGNALFYYGLQNQAA